MKKLTTIAAGATLLAAAAVAVPGSPAGAQDLATVDIVHALSAGLALDDLVTVCVDDDVVDNDFRLGEVIEAELPAGTYDVEVFIGPQEDCIESAPTDDAVGRAIGLPIIVAELTVEAGDNVSAIAYWDESAEEPGLTVLPNPEECLPATDGRIVARHAANAGPVDVLSGDTLVFEDLANGTQGVVQIGAGTYPISVVLADPPGTELVSGSLDLEAGTVAYVYVVGNVPVDEGDPTPVEVLVDVVDVETCGTPTTLPTTTTTTASTTTTARAVAAATATPRFTG